jgi:DNA-binding CsgD family transcriptional regulator
MRTVPDRIQMYGRSWSLEHSFYITAEQGTEARLSLQEAVVARESCRDMDRAQGGIVARENRSEPVISKGPLRASVRNGSRPLPVRFAPPSVRRPLTRASTTAERVTLARAVAEVRLALEEAAVLTAEAAARASSIAEALASLSGEEGRPEMLGFSPILDSNASLSPREREVLALVAAGQTNKAIAEALYVSPNTVKTHVASLLHKLQANTRVQLAAIATTYGLL